MIVQVSLTEVNKKHTLFRRSSEDQRQSIPSEIWTQDVKSDEIPVSISPDI